RVEGELDGLAALRARIPDGPREAADGIARTEDLLQQLDHVALSARHRRIVAHLARHEPVGHHPRRLRLRFRFAPALSFCRKRRSSSMDMNRTGWSNVISAPKASRGPTWIGILNDFSSPPSRPSNVMIACCGSRGMWTDRHSSLTMLNLPPAADLFA